MINPAQYTQVLQQASDPQLMQMLKRPDKIPSQFVVAEINRRQSMRQAAMAERQRQAGVQEMMTAQQAMPQQQAMMPEQRPVGMNIGGGGPNLFTALGMNTNAPGPERYGIPPFDPNRETVSEYNFRVNKARRDKMAMERMAIADAAMRTDADIQRPDGTAAGLRDAEMFMSTTGRSGDVEDLGSQASGVPSEASRRDGGVKDPFFKFGGVNFGNVFSDGSPADILKALQGTGETVSGPEKRGLAAERRRPGGDDKGLDLTATSGGRNNPTRSSPAQRAADEAALANREASFSRPAIVTPEKESSVTKRENAIPGGPIGPEPGATNQVETEASNTRLAAIKAAQEAASGDRVAANALNPDKPPIQTDGGVTSLAGQPPAALSDRGTTKAQTADTATQPKTETQPKTDDKLTPVSLTPSVFVGADTKNFTTLAEAFNKEQEAANTQIDRLRTQLRDDDRKRLDGLASDLNSLLEAQKDLAGVYDKTSMKPENRIFRAMIDAGLALAGSKESNFLVAVGQSGQKGLETFDRLNSEAKENLFKKYSSAVDIARAKVDITSQINQMARGIDATDVEMAQSQADRAAEAFARLQTAQGQDIEADLAYRASGRDDERLRLDEEQIQIARDRLGFDIQTGEFNRGIAERAQAVDEMLGETKRWSAIKSAENAEAKLDILADELQLSRDELNWRRVSKEIDQQIKGMELDQTPDAIAKLEWIKTNYGEDFLKGVLLPEKSTTGAVTEEDVLKAATAIYNADPNALIPGVEENNPQAAINYYANAIRTTFGKSGGGSATGPVDDTLEFED